MMTLKDEILGLVNTAPKDVDVSDDGYYKLILNINFFN
jgi:hypothetical protein